MLKMHSKFDPSKKLAPLLRQAFRQGVEAAMRGEDRNPYVPNSHFYHAWIAGWASLARGWDDADDLRLPRVAAAGRCAGSAAVLALSGKPD